MAQHPYFFSTKQCFVLSEESICPTLPGFPWSLWSVSRGCSDHPCFSFLCLC